MTIEPLTRYEPSSKEVPFHSLDSSRTFTRVFMNPDRDGAYINRFQLEETLRELLSNACDRSEHDAYNTVLKLVKPS